MSKVVSSNKNKSKELLFMRNYTPCLPGMHLYQAKKRMEKKACGGDMEGVREFLKGRIEMYELEVRPKKGVNSRKRIFCRQNVFMLFLVQVLSGMTCGHAVRFMQGVRAVRRGERMSSSSSAYCQARDRLELPLVMKLFRRLSDYLASRASKTWHGFKVPVVDGSGLDMPDTPRNRKAYPPRREKVKGTSFPQMNLVAVFELFSGGVVDWAAGSKHWGEQSLWKRLMSRFGMAMTITLGDCYYCSFGNIISILRKGGHCIFPLERNVNMEKIRRLGRKDCLVRLSKPSSRAKSWTQTQWEKFPSHIDLRLIERTISVPGFRDRKLRILTTLLDCKEYPADEIVRLQKRRWDAELRLRDIKTAMGMDHLSCKTPGMVAKEVAMFMIAYNLVRSMTAEASQVSGVDTARLSFSSAAAQTEEWIRLVLTRKPMARRKLMRTFLEMLAEGVNPSRPGRSEPRVVKRTDQRFPKMKQNRKSYAAYRKAA